MSENLPPSSPPPPELPQPQRKPPNFWGMFALGIGLVILSVILCIATNSPVSLVVGGGAAFVSVFFDGWRGIFIGAATLIGVVVLGVVIVCGSMGAMNMH